MNPKYETRIQKMPGACRLVDKDGNKVPLHFEKWIFWYFVDGIKEKIFVSSPARAMEMVAAAETKKMGAFASGPIPCNNGQHGVFGISCHGETKSFFDGRLYYEIKKAHDSVFADSGSVQTQSGTPMPIQSIKAADNTKDTLLACKVEFPIYDKEDRKKIIGYSATKYTYKCRAYHLKEEWVTVKVWDNNENDAKLKNVRVVETFVTTERDLQLLAESLGRDEIAELYCEQAIEL